MCCRPSKDRRNTMATAFWHNRCIKATDHGRCSMEQPQRTARPSRTCAAGKVVRPDAVPPHGLQGKAVAWLATAVGDTRNGCDRMQCRGCPWFKPK